MGAGGASRLGEVARLFLRLGVTAFGGPAAHVAVMEDECVRRRGWMSREQFLDVLGASNLIPGPTSTELAMHAGYHRAGWPGLVAAGCCFIGPAALIVGGVAALYVEGGRLPALGGVLTVVKPVALVIVIQALVSLARAALRTPLLILLAAGSVAGALAGLVEAAVLIGAGLLHLFVSKRQVAAAAAVLLAVPARALAEGAAAVGAVAPGALFTAFAKAGAVVLGSGYVLFAVLKTQLVEGSGWISEAQLLDAIAVGQITPGPVFTSATFIGYLLGGAPGAAIATIGVFLPAFAFTAASVRVLQRVRRSPAARTFLDGVNAAAVALIAVVAVALAQTAVTDAWTGAVALAAAVLVGCLRLNPSWVLAAAALIGAAATI
ncbi:MAG: chromate efflux transporter [Acidimicrobiia bacterium]|nr:chromate efflux transporter [Acidimicrobiia bacterium]